MNRLVIVIVAIGFGGLIYQSLFGLRDPEWSVPLAEEAAFTLAATILAHGEIRGCGSLEVERQYPKHFEIWVRCNGARRYTLTYKPSFQVNGRHASFNWLERAYCVQDENSNWYRAYLSLESARQAALVQSEADGIPYRVFAAHHYDVGGTVMSAGGEWEYERYIGGAPNQLRRGCELTELTDEFEDIAGFN